MSTDSRWSNEKWQELARYALGVARRFDSNLAQDLAQDALLLLALKAARVEDPAAWLAVVIRHLAWRRFSRRRQRLEAESRFASARPTIARPQRRLRWAFLKRLAPHHRSVLILASLGYRQREIARLLSCSVQVVGCRIARAVATANRLTRPEEPAKESAA